MAEKALIAMSGGVDSSVAALMMKNAGYDCIGVTMKLFGGDERGESGCCAADDCEDARMVAKKLGMPFYVFNYCDRFREEIIARFAESYLAGRTPNPCIDCNRFMKFGLLAEQARILGCGVVVTGHYARIERRADGTFALKKAVDASKDQSYVLYNLTQEQLSRTAFPLGEMSKDEVRKIAEENGFVNAKKPDSQDVCFIPDGDVASAVRRFSGVDPLPGDFVDEDGNILGRHEGICKYTVGQRKGLGIAYEYPLYVKKIDVINNRVVLAPGDRVFDGGARVENVNWIAGYPPEKPVEYGVRIRYHAPECRAEVTPDGGNGAVVRFEKPQRAVTPGQAAVFYDGDEVIGGGEIAEAI